MNTYQANKVTVSIIVPVYNVEKYLEQCLDSLVNQSLKNIEIIIVDDGSTDNSPLICDRYAAEYSFVKVIHQKNTGVSAARKKAMQIIKGEYYSFCDSDDFVDLNFYKNLYEKAVSSNADIVQCGYSMYYAPNDIEPFSENRTSSIIERKEGQAVKIMDVMLLSPSLTVRRIHRTALTKKYNIEFDPTIRIAEDFLFSCCTLLVCKKIAFVKQEGYFYRQNRDGRLTFINDERVMDLYWVFDKLNDFIAKNNLKKPWVLNHLAINIPLHQLYRVDVNLRKRYIDEMCTRLSLKNYCRYVIAGYVFSIKTRFIKYFILNCLCSITLLFATIFRNLKPVSHSTLKLMLYLRKGGFFKKFVK